MHSNFAKRIPKSENMAMRISLACVVHAALSTSNLLKLRLRLAQTDVQAENFLGRVVASNQCLQKFSLFFNCISVEIGSPGSHFLRFYRVSRCAIFIGLHIDFVV